jgi:F420H(2)-dependent quinone reductase
VEINVGPRRFGVTARPVPPGDPDYSLLWQIVNKNNGNRYAAYQKKTSRPIPVVVLTPQKRS